MRETLGGMREEAFTRAIPPGMNRHQYVMFRFRQALVESNGFDLIAMGRPEGSGCYCFANDLLSECIQQLEREYRYIIIDSEAGMEHIARGTIGKPDLLLIISDPGIRGLRTIDRIRKTAVQLGFDPEHIRTVINRYNPQTKRFGMDDYKPLAIIPDDPAVEAADIAAQPVSLVDAVCPAKQAVSNLADSVEKIAGEKREI